LTSFFYIAKINAIHTFVAVNRYLLPIGQGVATFLKPAEVELLQGKRFEVNPFEPSEHNNGKKILTLLEKRGWGKPIK